jgi:hypothetical protein
LLAKDETGIDEDFCVMARKITACHYQAKYLIAIAVSDNWSTSYKNTIEVKIYFYWGLRSIGFIGGEFPA